MKTKMMPRVAAAAAAAAAVVRVKNLVLVVAAAAAAAAALAPPPPPPLLLVLLLLVRNHPPTNLLGLPVSALCEAIMQKTREPHRHGSTRLRSAETWLLVAAPIRPWHQLSGDLIIEIPVIVAAAVAAAAAAAAAAVLLCCFNNHPYPNAHAVQQLPRTSSSAKNIQPLTFVIENFPAPCFIYFFPLRAAHRRRGNHNDCSERNDSGRGRC